MPRFRDFRRQQKTVRMTLQKEAERLTGVRVRVDLPIGVYLDEEQISAELEAAEDLQAYSLIAILKTALKRTQ